MVFENWFSTSVIQPYWFHKAWAAARGKSIIGCILALKASSLVPEEYLPAHTIVSQDQERLNTLNNRRLQEWRG